MKRILAGLLGVMLSFSAGAGNERAVRKTIEASMLVTGEVVIAIDGKLQSYTIDKQEALPAEVSRLLSRYLPNCIFDVVTASGKPETVKAKMSLQLVARQTDHGSAVISVRDSIFMDPDTPDYIAPKNLAPPLYPLAAFQSGITGTVYIVLRLNPDGTVAETHAEQVNMTVVGSEHDLQRARDMLAKASLKQAKRWTFEIAPARLAKPDPISVRVPVDYALFDHASKPVAPYGKWQWHVPGPYAPIPWEPRNASSGIGAMTPGRLYPLDSTIKLRDPPAAGS